MGLEYTRSLDAGCKYMVAILGVQKVFPQCDSLYRYMYYILF